MLHLDDTSAESDFKGKEFVVDKLLFLYKIKHSDDAAACVVTLNPMSSRWTRRILAGFPTRRRAYTLNIQNAIHKFKYRQGNRPAGEHLRVKPSITDKPILANHRRQRTVKLSAICREIMQINVKLGKRFDIFKNGAE